ncbi:MAG TPA: extracellular solute-binding protein [Candidatus Binatia bacterium]|jgi:iron(III) transport system substrate-binding protein
MIGMRKRRSLAILVGAMALLLLGTMAGARAETLDELYQQAMKEERTLNFYGTLAQINAVKILPVFEKRFAGIKINHVDATADKLAVRAITEARGGRILADIFQISLENILQLHEQKLLLEQLPPEADAYSANLKGSYWLANSLTIMTAAWNTNLVKKDDEPKQLEDFGDPKWKGKLIAEPRDVELLIGLARHKFHSDEKAAGLIKKIAANNVEFHKGHSDLAELLVAGQSAACVTCYSHHYPSRIKKGAPVGYLLTEGIATINATALAKGAPHPNTALLFARWAASEEGQRVYATGGRNPAHPKVEPSDKIRPEKIYPIGTEEIKDWKKYEKIWKEAFKLR